MTYYLAKAESGEDGILTVSYQERSSSKEAGQLVWRLPLEAIRLIPTTLELTLDGGAMPSHILGVPEAGLRAGGSGMSRD